MEAEPIRVLVVDDEVLFVKTLGKILARRGILVECAYEGRSAVQAVANGTFDAILLDLRMPGMDGLEALQEIRRVDPLTPVLVLTGQLDLDKARRAMKAGATEILLKPCPIDTILSAIENAREWKAIHQGLPRS